MAANDLGRVGLPDAGMSYGIMSEVSARVRSAIWGEHGQAKDHHLLSRKLGNGLLLGSPPFELAGSPLIVRAGAYWVRVSHGATTPGHDRLLCLRGQGRADGAYGAGAGHRILRVRADGADGLTSGPLPAGRMVGLPAGLVAAADGEAAGERELHGVAGGAGGSEAAASEAGPEAPQPRELSMVSQYRSAR